MRHTFLALNGGSLIMQDNTIALMTAHPRLGAILVDAQGAWPIGNQVSLRGTVLVNHSGLPTVLLRNWNGSTPVLADTVVQPGDVVLSSDGVILHRVKQAAHSTLDWLRAIAGKLHRATALLLHHLFG